MYKLRKKGSVLKVKGFEDLVIDDKGKDEMWHRFRIELGRSKIRETIKAEFIDYVTAEEMKRYVDVNHYGHEAKIVPAGFEEKGGRYNLIVFNKGIQENA